MSQEQQRDQHDWSSVSTRESGGGKAWGRGETEGNGDLLASAFILREQNVIAGLSTEQ